MFLGEWSAVGCGSVDRVDESDGSRLRGDRLGGLDERLDL
jgi:hypothetical protein